MFEYIANLPLKCLTLHGILFSQIFFTYILFCPSNIKKKNKQNKIAKFECTNFKNRSYYIRSWNVQKTYNILDRENFIFNLFIR